MRMNLQANRLFYWFITIILTLLCLWLIFKLIDQSVTLDHYTQHIEMINKQRHLLASVLNSIGKNVDEAIIRDIFSKSTNYSIFEKEKGHIVADQVSFFFSNGKLVKVDVGQQHSK